MVIRARNAVYTAKVPDTDHTARCDTTAMAHKSTTTRLDRVILIGIQRARFLHRKNSMTPERAILVIVMALLIWEKQKFYLR